MILTINNTLLQSTTETVPTNKGYIHNYILQFIIMYAYIEDVLDNI